MRASFIVLALGVVLGGCGSRAQLSELEGTGEASAGSSASGPAGSTATGATTTESDATGGPVSGSGQGVGGASSVGVTTGAGGTTTTTGTGGVSTTTSTGTAGAPTCPSFGDPCTGCMSKACPSTFCGCAENPECLALIGCIQTCGGGDACQQMCLAAHPDGISDLLLLSDCAGTTCNASCGWGTPANPCEKCILNDCSAEMNACLSMPDCGLLWQCLTSCDNLDLVCQQGCYAAHGSGTQLLQDLLDCAKSTCAPACP